ncbi:50S ribosomal protein L15 [Candidatus Micrarchaeota archaeon]|nr:50S ribosomal protein L15 [Candidatus Micrarchaeota archaeon]
MRTPKKIGKYRGTRSCGKGNVKNKRGAGNRGGRGMAGLKKHKRTWMVRYDPDHFGASGFKRDKTHINTVNLYEIENMIAGEKLKKEGEKFIFEFKGKILGTGVLTKPVNIKADKWTKKAEEKIKKIGGDITSNK